MCGHYEEHVFSGDYSPINRCERCACWQDEAQDIPCFRTEAPTVVKFAFISRHIPTPEQAALAAEKHIELVPVGDMDAFSVTPEAVEALGEFEGVVVVHPAAALRLQGGFLVGIFENGNRAPEGERSQFYAEALHIYNRSTEVTRLI